MDYRIVRSDLPKEEMKLYFHGIKWKKLRAPVQRLCVILPVEEHGIPEHLRKPSVVKQEESTEEVVDAEADLSDRNQSSLRL